MGDSDHGWRERRESDVLEKWVHVVENDGGLSWDIQYCLVTGRYGCGNGLFCKYCV